MGRPGRDTFNELSSRQREVLALVARGRTNGEIAQELEITLDGVKWHVREILSKLGVESRELAAELWRERSRRSMRGWLPALGWRIAAVAAMLGGLVAVVAVLAAMGSDESPRSETVAVATTALPTVTATPAGHMAFKECRRIENWRLPTIPEMAARVYANPRFGEDGHPYPPLHGFYLAPAVYNYYVTANSAQIEPSSFSGIWYRGPDTVLQEHCPEFTFGRAATQALWLKELELISLERQGAALVATARPAPGLFQVSEFDATDAGIVGDKGVESAQRFDSVRVVDERGNELFRDDRGFMTGNEPDGRFRFAAISSVERAQVPLTTSAALKVQVFVGGPAGRRGEARLLDEASAEVAHFALESTADTWSPVSEFELPTGQWRLEMEPDPGATTGVLIVRDGLPLP